MTSAHQQDSTPVVLLHGWGGSFADTWRGSPLEQALLDADRRVVECDLPGHGTRPASHDPGDYADIAAQVEHSLAGIERFDAVGFSLGGKLLLGIAMSQPERIRRLVVAGVGENIFRPESGELVAQALLSGVPPDAPEVLRSVVEGARHSSNDPLALAAVIRRQSPPPTPEALAAVQADTLLIVGDEDGIAGRLNPLKQALPTARATVIKGLGHLPTPCSPEFVTAAAEFILRLNADAPTPHHP